MKIQFEPRVVVIGVVAVISVVAIVALAQTPTPTCTPNLTKKLPFHLVMKCVQMKDFPNLVPAIAKDVPCGHRYYQIDDGAIDGALPVPAKEEACTHTNSNVTQRLAFANKADLDTFINHAGL